MEHEVQLPNVRRLSAADPESYTFRRFIEPEAVTERANAIAAHLLDNTPEAQPLLFMPVLHGALDFTMHVRNAITQLDHRREPAIRALAANRYGNGVKGGTVRVTHMPHLDDLQGHAGFLIEDIIETGRTVRHIQPIVAHTLGVVGTITLLQKRQGIDALLEQSRPPETGPYGQPHSTHPHTRDPITVNYAAFEIGDDAFVIGEGLDYSAKGRGLRGIYYQVVGDQPAPKYIEPDFISLS